MIRGERTNLRAIEPSDTPVVHTWLNEPESMRSWGIGDPVVSLTETRRRIEEWLDDERRWGRPSALIIENLDAEPIGLIVLGRHQADARSVELSFLIGEERWRGQGFGGDAFDALLDACFLSWDLHRVSLRSEDFNARAHGLYRSRGFVHEGTLRAATFLDGRRHDVHVFGLTATDYFAVDAKEDTAVSEAISRAQDPAELFDVLTADGTPTGERKARSAVHRDGDWHRAVHVWIAGRDQGGDSFLVFQRRGPWKDTSPGLLDATVGGHYRAGESLDATLRETEEEIGVAMTPGDLLPLGVRLRSNEAETGVTDREIQDVFLRIDHRPLTAYRPNPAELSELVRVSIAGALALFSGEIDAIACSRLPANSEEIIEGVVALADFIPNVDRYFYRVANAAERALKREAHVAV